MKQKKILMVCLGNICRSPLAEGILANKCKELDVLVDSAGTSSYHIGQAPDPRSQDIAKKYGIDISNQKARHFQYSDFEGFDIIYVMDSSNHNNVVALAKTKTERDKVKLILNEIKPEMNSTVPDPYFGGGQGFETVFQLLDQACEIIKTNIENEL